MFVSQKKQLIELSRLSFNIIDIYRVLKFTKCPLFYKMKICLHYKPFHVRFTK